MKPSPCGRLHPHLRIDMALVPLMICMAIGGRAHGEEPHWSQSEPFGHNVPKGLRADTLDDVQDQLAASGLEVTQGRTEVILTREEIGDYGFVGTLVRFPDGHIQVNAGKTQLRSGDAGRSWKRIQSKFALYSCRTRDGQTLEFTGDGGVGPEPTGRRDTNMLRKELIRSRDNGKTETSEMATLYLPARLKRITLRHARIVQVSDGSLVACCYASFQEDPWVVYPSWVMKTGVIHERRFQKNRIVIIRSENNGRTWTYQTTVAFDIEEDTKERILGYSEPDMVRLQSGEILVFMRTAIGGGIRPMYMSLSRDDGKTWSNATPVTDRGVSPCVIEMQNGTIVVGYGRPHNWLMFSTDRGQTWTGHFQFYKGPKAWDAWNQIAVEEVAPDTLLVTYRHVDPKAKSGTLESRYGDLMGTYFTVKRRGPGPRVVTPPGLVDTEATGNSTISTALRNRDEAVHRRRRVILNDDAGMVFQQLEKPEDFVAEMAATIDTNIDSIWLSSMVGADLYVYDCKVGQQIGEQIYPGAETMKGEVEGFKKHNVNYKMFQAARTDALRETVKLARRHGKEVFASFRMNMVQDSWRPNFQTRWKREHPDWCLGDRSMAGLKDDARSIYWSALNFELQAVRDQRIAVIEDLCTNYDLDGMELDWWRWPMFFKPTMDGKPVEPRHIEIMNNFVRRVRDTTNTIERRRNRPLLLAARVFDTEEISYTLGLDPRTWLAEGLIDILVVGGTYTYYSIETEKWVELARPHNVPVYVSLYRPRGIERDRARTHYHMSRGAAGMHVFNWLRDVEAEKSSLSELGEPEVTLYKDKHYVMSGPFRTLGFRHILREHLVPVRLEHGAWRSATLKIGDDVRAAKASGRLKSTTLHLKFENFSPASDKVIVKLNGTELSSPTWETTQDEETKVTTAAFQVSAPLLVLHENKVDVLLQQAEARASSHVDLAGVELWVRYQDSGSGASGD